MPDLATEILAEIRHVVAAELEITRPVALEAELAGDLEIDSVGAIVLAVALEDRFRVKLSDGDAGVVVTVGDLVALVERRVGETVRGETAVTGGEGPK